MRVEVIRDELLRLLRKEPFKPFQINVENGDQVIVEHPENLAMGRGDGKGAFANRVHVLGGELVTITTLDAISSVVEIDEGEPLGENPPK